ncbi:MAG: DUF2267 domain-containing protein [Chloroflexota bacterium]
MTESKQLEDFYNYVQECGKLRTEVHAKRWTDGVLRTLGVNLDRGTKKKLSEALPEELASSLTRVFWLLHFRNPQLTREEFQGMVARRSGNTDADFAYFPTRAVFGGLKRLVNEDLQREVADNLAPDIAALWQEA